MGIGKKKYKFHRKMNPRVQICTFLKIFKRNAYFDAKTHQASEKKNHTNQKKTNQKYKNMTGHLRFLRFLNISHFRYMCLGQKKYKFHKKNDLRCPDLYIS